MSFKGIYEKLCELAGKSEGLKDIHEPPEELKRNLEFSGIDAKPDEVVALSLSGLIFGALAAAVFLFLSFLFDFPLLPSLLVLPLPAILFFSIGWYPSWKVETERAEGWGNTLRFISYLVAALKINPNLEQAANFTVGAQGKSLIENFRDELWKTCMGIHNNVGEALTKFSLRWEDKSEELKRSIDLIKSSFSERKESTRKRMLDRSLDTTFEGIRRRMEEYSDEIQLPTIVIYGIGVLLPLILIAVLPVLSSSGIRMGAVKLTIIYCFALPLGVYLLKKQVLSKRPTVFVAPDIPPRDDKMKAMFISAAFATLPGPLAFLLGLGGSLLVLVVLWSLSSSAAVFCYLSSKETYRVRKRNSRLEEEFTDTMAQLGNQLKSNRPAENAFRRTAEITRGSEMSEIFERTSANLRVGGMDISSALFDPKEGSLKEVHSIQIRHTFRFLTDLLSRSVEAAGRAIINVVDQLKELNDVENQIRRDLREITNSMKSVSLFFAPFVASVTVQLQRVLSEKTGSMPFFGGGVNISTPSFMAVLGFYIIVLTILLLSYAVEIEHGDDDLVKRMEIARGLPMAMSVFTLGLLLGQQIFSILVG